MVPASEENSTKASRSPVSSCRFRAESTLDLRTAARRSGVTVSSTPSSSTPAACTTADRSRSASTAASASRSAASQAITVALSPNSGASPPRRLISTTCSAPLSSAQRATWRPSAPVPPVINTVPRGFHWSAVDPARTSLRTNTPAARTATSFSPSTPDSTARTRCTARVSSVSGRSSRPPQRSGCSRAATRPSPHTVDRSGRLSGSVRPIATAPRVTHHNGAAMPASPRAWMAASDSCASDTDSTPEIGSVISRSWAASSARSAEGSIRTTSVPSAPTSSSSAVASTSQVPVSSRLGTPTIGFHTARYRQLSTVD